MTFSLDTHSQAMKSVSWRWRDSDRHHASYTDYFRYSLSMFVTWESGSEDLMITFTDSDDLTTSKVQTDLRKFAFTVWLFAFLARPLDTPFSTLGCWMEKLALWLALYFGVIMVAHGTDRFVLSRRCRHSMTSWSLRGFSSG
jgi:hypothetical protein